MKYQLFIISSLLLLYTQFSEAQYYNTGQDPASLRWLQVKTDKFRVIYPEAYGAEGIQFAKTLDEACLKITSVFPEKKFRIPVVIHNYTTESNGYVAWAPRRMEIYPTPEQNSIPLETKSQLAIHELTHVIQLVSLNQGFSKAMSLILGEQFAGITSILLPLWYYEGNAVFAESVLTKSGRGRIPSFQQQFKAITLENDRIYKYDKIVNDSYKTYIPDHYQSGYQMVTYALAKEGLQVWNKTLDYTAKNPFLLDPVNISLTRNAGITKKKLYKETFDTLRNIWEKELSEKQIITYEPVNPPKKEEFINYYSPVYAGKDSIIAIKTSMKDPSFFVLINTSARSEKKIHTPGFIYPYILSYAEGKIVWVESKPDPRWQNRNYSVIKIMDIKTGVTNLLSRKSRFMAASISPDGSVIAAVENTTENRNSLVLIDPGSGMIIRTAGSPQNGSLQRPRWEPGGKKITVISLTEEGEGILSYSIEDQSWKTLVEYGKDDLQLSLLRNDSLFYISSASGTDNVYLKTSGDKTICLTRSKYGINDFFLAGSSLIISNYSPLGYDICLAGINDVSDPALEQDKAESSFLINRFDIKPEASGAVNISEYKPEPYRKFMHLFRFHSWMPFYADIEEVKDDPASIRPGFTLLSQNQLSTLTSAIGYEYTEDKQHVLHSRLTWEGWYPVFESRIDYGGDPGVYTGGESVSVPNDLKKGIRSLNSVNIPLSFNSGKFSQYLQPSVTHDFRNNYVYVREEGYDYGQVFLSGRLFFYNYYRSSVRDIYPRWAQTIDLNYYFAPFDDNIYSPSASVRTSFYIPGLLPNNGIKFRFEKEKQGESGYTLNNRISFPRGYKNIISKDLDFLSVNYVFPLAYPDLNISSLMYLKRVRCTLFGDYASGTDNLYLKETETGVAFDYRHDYKEIFRSYGFELLADFHVFRLPFMISGGVQTSWTGMHESPVYQILFNIELFGMAINREKL